MSSPVFSDRELEQLRNSVYQGYQMKPRNYAEEYREYDAALSDDSSSDPPEFRDQIDFSRYDGSRTSTDNLGKPGHDGDVNTSELWNRVRKEIGIKDVDSQNDLRQMFDYVTAYNKPKETSDPTPAAEKEPETPPTFEPSDDLNDARDEFDDTRLDNPENSMPRLDKRFDAVALGGDDNSMAAIRGGDDLNEHYQNKFIPSLRAEANLAAREMGERGRFHIANFTGKIPELGSGADLFEQYIDKLG
tara:strand:- start:306 stop:1043 length:738 start_codon:yes stop_codon:yes gene_type:complete